MVGKYSGDTAYVVSPFSQYPEGKFVYEDLDTVRTYINLAFGEASANEGSAKGGSVKEDS